MDDLKNRVEGILNSPIGCDFLLSVEESGLTPKEVGDPLNSFWLAAESEDPDRVAPRIIIRGQKVDGGCDYFLRLGVAEDGLSTHARTVEEDQGDCKKVIEVWTVPN